MKGTVGIVTGASRGIGGRMAQHLVDCGATVVLVARSEATLRDNAEECSDGEGRALPFAADVTDLGAVVAVRRFVESEFGRLDFVAHCAGTTIKKPIVELEDEEWRRVMDTNLTSLFYLARELGPLLFRTDEERHAKFLTIGSVGSTLAIPLSSAYCASKGGLVQTTRVMAIEWARHRVDVNAICPGYILTPLSESVLKVGDTYKKVTSRIPAGEIGSVDDIAHTAEFLLSQKSNYITGTTINVDGGLMGAAYTLE
jgi:NAD(P)-dependent dehydrogenase (short-subunit alcohol dehydrogenase family)